MSLARFRWTLAGIAGMEFVATISLAQQATGTTPQHTVGDSFFERTGVHWGLNWNNGFFRFGGPGMAAPPLGNFDPGAGANFGFGFGGGGTNGFFNFGAAQGSRQGLVSQSPSMTLTSGFPAFLSDASLSPFVIGHVPVVGGFPVLGTVAPIPPQALYQPAEASAGHPAVQAALRQAQQSRESSVVQAPVPPPNAAPAIANAPQPGSRVAAEQAVRPAARPSSAATPVASVEEARQARREEVRRGNVEAQAFCDRAREAERSGSLGVARIYYQMAARRAEGELKAAILVRLDAVADAAQK